MNILKKLRDALAKKIASNAANIAANSVDHCDLKAKEVIAKTIENSVQKLLDPDDQKNLLPDNPNAPIIFRSDKKEHPFHIEVKGIEDTWKSYQKNNNLDFAIKENMEIRAEWTFKI